MFNLTSMLKRAQTSSFFMRLLNFGLNRRIPFNRPHSFRILEIGDDSLTTFLPYKKANLNHIKGMHACALATLSEFTTGLSLLRRLNAKKYRIILKSLKMEYYYQGKSGVTASYTIDNSWLEEKIFSQLKNEDAIIVMMEIESHDTKGNHISTGFIEWQVKDWKKVRTKLI